MEKKGAKIYIGTSGWSYDHWKGIFYPENLSGKLWLSFYSQYFDTVEINASFYHQMTSKTYETWRKTVPKNFVFSVKLSRYLTHIEKLKNPREPWRRFINGARELEGNLGTVLVQLPPRFRANPERLAEFLKTAKDKRLALEVRDSSWFCDEVYKILRQFRAALVWADSESWPAPHEATTDFLYIRMHGPSGLYSSKYTSTQIKKLAKIIIEWKSKVKKIFVYFNNDTRGYAIINARQLRSFLDL